MKRITRIGLSFLLATTLQLSLTTCTKPGYMKDSIKEESSEPLTNNEEELITKEDAKTLKKLPRY